MLSTSIRRTAAYQVGGVLTLIALPFDSARVPQFTVTRSGGAGTAITGITFPDGVKPAVIEFEDNSCGWTDNLTGTNNKYLTPGVVFKVGGYSDARAAQMQALNLGRHAFLLKTNTGVCVLLGEQSGLGPTQNNGGFGAGNDDLAGNDLVLSGVSTIHAGVVPESVFSTVYDAVAV